jgi:hypothetical protein
MHDLAEKIVILIGTRRLASAMSYLTAAILILFAYCWWRLLIEPILITHYVDQGAIRAEYMIKAHDTAIAIATDTTYSRADHRFIPRIKLSIADDPGQKRLTNQGATAIYDQVVAERPLPERLLLRQRIVEVQR